MTTPGVPDCFVSVTIHRGDAPNRDCNAQLVDLEVRRGLRGMILIHVSILTHVAFQCVPMSVCELTGCYLSLV